MADTPNIRHLLAFTEVARRGSVSAAARAIHISQPAVSQEIARIEASLGAQLFERTALGLQLTEAGEAVRIRIDRALAILQDGLSDLLRAAAAMPRRDLLRRISSMQLLLLATVVEQGSFAKAARELDRSRSTVQKAVRQLEQTLRVALFETTSHGLQPTREAARLVFSTRLAFAEMRQAHCEAGLSRGTEVGSTVIGAMPLARSFLVPAAILEFAKVHPAHTVCILDGPYESLLVSLRSGAADVLVGALRSPAPAQDVSEEHLFDDPLALVVRARHPLASRQRVRTADLGRYAWVAPRRGSPLRRHYEDLLTLTQKTPREAAVECNSLVAARALLLASDRVMLLSAHQVHHELASGELVALPHPKGPVSRAIGMTTRRNWRPTAVQVMLLDSIRRQAKRLAVQLSAAR